MPTDIVSRLSRPFGRLLRSRKGVAAFEFIFVMPIALAAYFGLMELNNYITIKTKVLQTVLAVEDVVGLQSSVDNNTFSTICGLVPTIMSPISVNGLTLTIVNETTTSSTATPTIAWTVSGTGSSSTISCSKTSNGTATLASYVKNMGVTGASGTAGSSAALSALSFLIVTGTYTYSNITPHGTYFWLNYGLSLPPLTYTKTGSFRGVHTAVPYN